MATPRSLRNLTPDDVVQATLRAFAASQRTGKLPHVGGVAGHGIIRTHDATYDEPLFVATLVEELERRLGAMS